MIYYVATTGLDTAVGSMEAPFRTINRAAQVARSGDTVNVLRFRNDSLNVILRPSGIEPKLKMYLQIKLENKELLKQTLLRLKEEMAVLING